MRTARKRANIGQIQKLLLNNGVVDTRPLVAAVMRESDCTLQEIADVLQCSRQVAQNMIFKLWADRVKKPASKTQEEIRWETLTKETRANLGREAKKKYPDTGKNLTCTLDSIA